jgi:hypothetical protein
MPITINDVRSWTKGARMAFEIQSARLTPAITFGPLSPVWFTEDIFNEDQPSSEFQGNHGGVMFEHRLPRNRTVIRPNQTVLAAITPEMFVRLFRVVAGDFSGGSPDAAAWPLNIANYASVAFRDQPEGDPGQIWRIEDAWIPSLSLMSPGIEDGSLGALFTVLGEDVTIEDTPGASFTIPDSPTVAQMGGTFNHRAMKLIRDPAGTADEFLPILFELHVRHQFESFPDLNRITTADLETFRTVKGVYTEIEVRVHLQMMTETKLLREDARLGTLNDLRVTWVAGANTITIDLRDLDWATPDRVARGRDIGEVVLIGRALSDGVADAVQVAKSGF